jgi:hypothetical protein
MATSTAQDIEYGTLSEDRVADTLVCVCGNHPAVDGYITCDAEGTPCHMMGASGEGLPGTFHIADIATGTAHFACDNCGRIYSDALIFKENSARVVNRLSPEALAAAQDLYWRSNDMAPNRPVFIRAEGRFATT